MPLEYVVALNCFFLRGLAGALQHHSTMMDYALNALAPKLEVGQEALYDALRSRDSKRAARIIERVANNHRAQSRTGATAAGTLQREKEADLNAPDSRGLRPIHLAAMLGLSDNVRALLAAGIPVDAMGAEGNTALHLAAYNKQDGAVAVLMRAGASPNQENIKGKTPIDLAKTETTLTLLCPLHYAASRSMLDNLVSLVAKGVSVRTVGRGGETPLHASAASGTPDAARLLLARGAHPLTKNAAGETPLDLARRFGSGSREGAEMVDLLEGAEALAVVEKTEVEAAEEKRLTAARGGKVAYEEGDEVFYVRDGDHHPATVMQVHRDDEDPYYTIRVNSTGRERQTDANHLVRNSGHLNEDGTWEGAQTEQMGTTEYCESGSRQEAGDADSTTRTAYHTDNNVSAPTIVAGTSGQNFVDDSKVEGRFFGGNQDGDRAGGERPAGFKRNHLGQSLAGDWATARTLFTRAAMEIEEEVAGGGGKRGAVGFRNNGVSSDSQGSTGSQAGLIAAAFAAVPAEEASEILRRHISRTSRVGVARGSVEDDGGDSHGLMASSFRKRDIVGGASSEGQVGRVPCVWLNSDSCLDNDRVGSQVKVNNPSAVEGDQERIDEGRADGLAHAIADACREITLECLLGGRVGGPDGGMAS